MAITTLAGTKWKFKSSLDASSFPSNAENTYRFNYISGNNSYTSFVVGSDRLNTRGYICAGLMGNLYVNGEWTDEKYRLFEITDGQDVANAQVISFFTTNAIQIKPTKKITKDGSECVVEYAINDIKGRKITDTYATFSDIPDVDQIYDSTSENAQSGLAVAQAIAGIPDPPKGVTELSNQYIRITDLEAGVYKLTYNGTKYLYYNGSTSTNSQSITGGAGSVILVVSKNGTTYWHWYYINGTTSYATLYYGYTSTSSGYTSSKAINSLLTSVTIPSTYKQVPNSTYANYSLGYYYSTSIFGTSSYSLNLSNYLYPGQYAFSLGTSSLATHGAPYTPTGTVRAMLITNAPYYTSNATYRPYVEQEIIVFDSTVRHFKRKWTASNGAFSTWEEQLPNTLETEEYVWEV